ncbi:MAG: hypothetical protein ABJA61_01540 [Caldimonas sp.]
MSLLDQLGLTLPGSPAARSAKADDRPPSDARGPVDAKGGGDAAPADQAQRDEARKPLADILTQILALVLSGNDDDARNRINAELTKLQAKVDTADKLKSLKSATTAWKALMVPAQELLARASQTKEVVDWVVDNYRPQAKSAQAAINAVPLATAKAVLQKAFDDLEAGRKTREKTMDLSGIQADVFPPMQKLNAVATRVAAVAAKSAKDLALVAKQVTDLGAAATPKLKADLKAVQDKWAVWPAGASVADIEASVGTFESALKTLAADALALVDSQPGAVIERERKALEKSLKAYDETAFSLDDAKRPDATKKSFAYKKRYDDANAIKNIDARRTAYLALERDVRGETTKLKKGIFTEQLASKGGKEALDKEIAAMPSESNSPEDIATCEAAISARFGVELKVPLDQAQKKTLPRLYKMLAKVPEWQSKQGKFKELDFGVEPGKGSYYQAGKISLNEIDPIEGGSVKRPDNDPDGSKTVLANYFDFTTLHEVGHAVDAKINFMGQRMGPEKAQFGGWKREDFESVIVWLGEKSGFYQRHSGAPKPGKKEDLDLLLRRFLTTKACAKPANASQPMGSLIAGWNAIVNDPVIVACIDGMLVADKVWEGAGPKAAKIAINQRVCHEAYGNEWYSYALASRASTGVSDYQWRAPGEWFAEIYALYYLGKLSASHSMFAWFEENAKDEKKASLAPTK